MKTTQQPNNAVRKNLQARRITGQGMTEYIIIVALIAISAIAVVGFFGDVVQQQFTGMAQRLAGDANTSTAATAAKSAKTEADKASNLKAF